ncbi:MAG: asparagine synthase (glutamine-hydrolyzing) [Phycisphaerales bacterium]|nr:asparagine synthase (glutamine-hydrolyzing) [Planctomycetota bacterium]
MCGICGIHFHQPNKDGLHDLKKMMAAIAHRGPDGDGSWSDPTGRTWFGHRRLSVIDVDGGRQPMFNEDGSIALVFNGCIYNYQELARELRAKGHKFKTHCDTEVIVHAYEEWGDECVQRFNGMWAFVVHDGRNGRIFCSRDRLGIKPLYFTESERAFAFASEIKALLAAGFAPPAVDRDGLRQYMTFQLCLGDRTLFDRVRRLPPGCNLILEPGKPARISSYWDIHFGLREGVSESEFVEELRFLLDDAVRLQLVSDVPLGAHLSGGLDSSTVVCLARKLLASAPLKTFTGAFAGGPAYDETSHAKIVAQRARTDYIETFLGPEDFRESIGRIIYHMDEPAAGPGVFPQYFVSKTAAKHVKVVLGGQGGDENFIGYARYIIAYLEECLKGAIFQTAHQRQYVATLQSIVPSLPTLEQYVPMLRTFWSNGLFGEPSARYFALMDRSADSREIFHCADVLDQDATYSEFRSIFEAPEAASKINRIMYFDFKTHLQSLLHVEDRTSMAVGLESRVPLLDHRLVELMASIPPVIKFRDGKPKNLFRQAVAGFVPQEILNRTDKMGFPVPLNEWMGGPLRSFVADILLDKRSRERGLLDVSKIEKQMSSQSKFSRGLWGAICLELWHRQFIDGAGAGAARPAAL